MWTGIAARTTLFVYNKDMLSEADLPKSMLDLAAPEWQGRWGAAPAGADFQAIVSALLELRGPEETGELARRPQAQRARLPRQFRSDARRQYRRGRGRTDLQLLLLRRPRGTGESSDKLGLHYFRNEDPGAFVSISGGGVLKSIRQSRRGAGLPRLRHRTQGPGHPSRRQQLRIPDRRRGRANATLPALDTLGYPKVDPSLLNAQEVVAADDRRGRRCSAAR